MKKLGIKYSLLLNYFVFAVLLNTVGTVILQVQRSFDITKSDASILEGFKDIPIALASFLLGSLLPKIGLKKSMLTGLFLVSGFCLITPLIPKFWYFKLLFVVFGISFALVKVAVFAVIGLITEDEKEHSGFMGILESVFMAGILLGNIGFSLFIDDNNPKSLNWLNIYVVIAIITLLAFFILLFSSLNEKEGKIKNQSFIQNFKEMLQISIKPLILIFVASIFIYVLIEQSFQTWFPTFYKVILNTPASMSIQAGAVLAGALMIGRLLGGIILSRVRWIYVLSICLLFCLFIVIVTIPLAENVVLREGVSWFDAPLVVYLMPLMGLFLAPIYPTLNSTILTTLPKHMHSSMSGLIVVFSALGGTTGSIITGNIFDHYGGITAFYLTIFPLVMIFIVIWVFELLHKKLC